MLFSFIIKSWLAFFWFLILVLLLWIEPRFYTWSYSSLLTSSWVFWWSAFLIQMLLLYLVSYKKAFKKYSLFFAIIALVVWFLWYYLFYEYNPIYVYKNSLAKKYYADENNFFVENLDEYKKALAKYWFSWNKTYLLKTSKEHKEILELASKDKNWESLYAATTMSALWLWIEDVFKEYNNKTFEVYFFKVATRNISNVHYLYNHPSDYEYNTAYMLHENWPFLNWLRYLAEFSNYEDVKKESKKVIDAYDYYVNFKDEKKVNDEIIIKYSSRWWFQYWDDIETGCEKFTDNIQWLEHNRVTYDISYDSIVWLQNSIKEYKLNH
jgi:hypothetical protein